eukprot:scaffold16568_cov119-Isochrysis_galbana.AAC.4
MAASGPGARACGLAGVPGGVRGAPGGGGSPAYGACSTSECTNVQKRSAYSAGGSAEMPSASCGRSSAWYPVHVDDAEEVDALPVGGGVPAKSDQRGQPGLAVGDGAVDAVDADQQRVVEHALRPQEVRVGRDGLGEPGLVDVGHVHRHGHVQPLPVA